MGFGVAWKCSDILICFIVFLLSFVVGSGFSCSNEDMAMSLDMGILRTRCWTCLRFPRRQDRRSRTIKDAWGTSGINCALGLSHVAKFGPAEFRGFNPDFDFDLYSVRYSFCFRSNPCRRLRSELCYTANHETRRKAFEFVKQQVDSFSRCSKRSLLNVSNRFRNLGRNILLSPPLPPIFVLAYPCRARHCCGRRIQLRV